VKSVLLLYNSDGREAECKCRENDCLDVKLRA
jgi:hypothetical protein